MDMQDISVKVGEHLLNCRVSALIRNKDKVLVHHAIGNDHYTLPGGRIKEGENSIEALQREIKEEMGFDTEFVRPVSIIENFFEMNGQHYHEFLITHELKFKNEEIYNKNSYDSVEENKKGKLEFVWFNTNEIETKPFVPELLKKVVKDNKKEFVHIINDERK